MTSAGKVQLRVLNQTGQVLGNIYNGFKEKGVHRVNLQSSLFDISRLPAGAYYLQMETASGRQTVSLIKAN
jgi:flagellar hook assembly protein FlgD